MIVLRKGCFALKCPKKASLSNGIDLVEGKDSKSHRILNKYVQAVRERPEDFIYYDVIWKGNTIGSLHLRKLREDTMEIAWIDINNSHRGNNYATEIIKWCIDLAKELGFKKIELEVPGNAPDARHIYEKLGFNETGEVRELDNTSWNGLSRMRMKVFSLKITPMIIVRQKEFGKYDKALAEKEGVTVEQLRQRRAGFKGTGTVHDRINLRSNALAAEKAGIVGEGSNIENVNKTLASKYKNNFLGFSKSANKRVTDEVKGMVDASKKEAEAITAEAQEIGKRAKASAESIAKHKAQATALRAKKAAKENLVKNLKKGGKIAAIASTAATAGYVLGKSGKKDSPKK